MEKGKLYVEAEHFINTYGPHTMTVIKKSRESGLDEEDNNAQLFEMVEQILNEKETSHSDR
jgi:hypothetical protein